MMMKLCLVYLFVVIISVSSNPISQPAQSYNVCSPMSYSNPTCSVAIQQPSSSSSYPQGSTVQVPTTYLGPLGETLNQIVLNRILTNPSLQKIINPNTKLYNQNGDEVQRQVANSPNVINNYFIVPPEFFSINETVVKTEGNVADFDQLSKRPRRRKVKRRLKKPKEEFDEDGDVVVTNKKRKRRKNNQPKNIAKRKRIDDDIKSDELIETTTRDQEKKMKPKVRSRKQQKEEMVPISDEYIEDEYNELEDLSSVVPTREKKLKTPRKLKPKPNTKRIDKESNIFISEGSKPAIEKHETVFIDKAKEEEGVIEVPKKSKKDKRPESLTKSSEDKTLKNIELPTDIANRDTPENRLTRDSNRNVAKKVSEHKNRNTVKHEPLPNMTPFPDDILKNFFPYMPMDNFDNPYTNYPTNFDQYYKYLNPVRNTNTNRNKNKHKKQNIQNRKSNGAKSSTHDIEIKLKPKKKENTQTTTTEVPDTTETLVTTEESKDMLNEEEQSTESIEDHLLTTTYSVIPMEMPHKVSPFKDNEESSSKESYETFSKLEDLYDFIMPELGTEDEVHPIRNNGIINDYYPVFDDDIQYSSDVEMVNKLDDRYFYETRKEDTTDRDRKLDRYEDSRSSNRDSGKKLESSDLKTKTRDRDINEFKDTEYLDHISTISDIDSSGPDKVRPYDEIKRVKIPPKNTRPITESVETVFAGSKVIKYGMPPNKPTDQNESGGPSADENSSSSESHTSYVIGKSIGCPEDYW